MLIGGTWSGSNDEHRFPPHGRISGLVLHALAIDSVLAAKPLRPMDGPAVVWSAALLAGLTAAAVLSFRRLGRAVLAAGGLLAGYLVFSVCAFSLAGWVVPVTWPALLLLGGLAAALALRAALPSFPPGA